MNLDFLKNKIADSNDGNDEDAYKAMAKDAKEYADLQLQLFKLNLVEKSSQILSLLVVIIAGAILLMAAFVFFSLVFVLWMNNLAGSMMTGFVILGAFFIVLFILFWLLRKKIMINPMIKKLSAILFKDSEPVGEEDDDE
jgi:uncharacterized membrane protein YqjE